MSRIANILRNATLRPGLESDDVVAAGAPNITAVMDEAEAQAEEFESEDRALASGEAALEAIQAIAPMKGTGAHVVAVAAIGESFYQANGGVSIVPSMESMDDADLVASVENAISGAIGKIRDGLLRVWDWIRDLFGKLYKAVSSLWTKERETTIAFVESAVENPTPELVAAATAAIAAAQTDVDAAVAAEAKAEEVEGVAVVEELPPEPVIEVVVPSTKKKTKISARAIVHKDVRTPRAMSKLRFSSADHLVSDVMEPGEYIASQGVAFSNLFPITLEDARSDDFVARVSRHTTAEFKNSKLSLSATKPITLQSTPAQVETAISSMHLNLDYKKNPRVGARLPRATAVRIMRDWRSKHKTSFPKLQRALDDILKSVKTLDVEMKAAGSGTGAGDAMYRANANLMRRYGVIVNKIVGDLGQLVSATTDLAHALQGTRRGAIA